MDKSALETFVAVAENGSFSQAGEQLFKTQPAVSKRIAALEEDVGCRLFDRLGKEVRTTEAGDRLLQHARRILADIDASRDDVRSLAGGVTGRLQLGTSHHIGLHRLPAVLKPFVQHYPEVELDLRFMDSEEACDAVVRGSLELAVVTLPKKPDGSLATTLVWSDPLCIMCAPDHPLALALRTTALSADDLARWPAILPARGTITRNILLNALRPSQIRIDTTLESNYLETIKMLVSVGLGWSALPASMLDDSVATIPVAGITIERELGIVNHRMRTPSRAARAFKDMLITEAATREATR